MTDKSDPPPVFLPEPAEGPAAAPPPPVPQRRPDLHRDWDRLLAPDERVVWQGQPSGAAPPRRRVPGWVIAAIVVAVAAMAIADESPWPVLIGFAAYFLFSRRNRGRLDTDPRRYLLTDRAAHVARAEGDSLVPLASLQLDRARPPERVANGVRFGTAASGAEVNFVGIDDADDLLARLRDAWSAAR